MSVPSLKRIEEAAAHIDPVFLNTPQFELDALNDQLGFRLVCKLETLNPIRSFKGRGTSWLLANRASQGKAGFICASAGNFGQGMAYACRQRGLALTVFAADNANALKLERMRALGADVRLQGQDFDAAKAAARTYAKTHELTFVEDAKDQETAEGAGTIGKELTRYAEPFGAVLVPLGNGALINGIGAWFKAKSPQTRVIGVVASAAPAMALSWQQGSIISTETADTIADGIGVRVPVPEALAAMRTTVDAIVQVSDDELIAAMQSAQRTLGVVLEPAGAAGLAAAQVYQKRFQGKLAATVLCGSNLTTQQLRRWLS